MNSRDRVLAALAHREPDRVPISFGDAGFSGVFDAPPHGYRALCAHLGIVDCPEPVNPQDDCGVVFNPVGRDLTFLGGFDIQDLLPHGSAARIRDGAKELIDTYGPGGGFIFCPSHQIQGDVPPENVVAMYDAAFELGGYPIPGAAPDLG